MVEEEHTKAHISLVNYELSWQKYGWTYFQSQVPQESITHRGKQWNLQKVVNICNNNAEANEEPKLIFVIVLLLLACTTCCK